MFMVVRMKKEDKSLSGRDIMELTKDGRLSILIKLKTFKIRDL
jgi:hypothetical protein